jgi:hypothetical protein
MNTARNRLIDHAGKHHDAEVGQANLRKKLKEAALRRAARDRVLAEEWSILEDAASPGAKG